MPSKHKNKRRDRFTRKPVKLPKIQPRDFEILRQVCNHRFLTSADIVELVSGSRQVILRRLNSLYHSGLLDRPAEQSRPYFNGSQPMVYSIEKEGAELLALYKEVPWEKVSSIINKNKKVNRQLDHSLMISKFMTLLKVATLHDDDIRLFNEKRVLERFPDLKGRKTGMPCLPVKALWKNKELKFNLTPDQVFCLYFPKLPQKFRHAYYFLEADRSTMPIMRSDSDQSSFHKKLLGYTECFWRGTFKKHLGSRRVRVLTIAKTDERIRHMMRAGTKVDKKGRWLSSFLYAKASEFDYNDPVRIFGRHWRNGLWRKNRSIIE